MKIFIVCLFVMFTQAASAQKIFGTVTNAKGELMPYASITVKGTTKGTSANEKGKFALNILPGTYTIVCRSISYNSAEKTVTVTSDTEINFILDEQKLTMETVVIKSGGEDPAYEIIRNAIKKRTYYQKQVAGFTCNIYGKDLIRLRSLPKRVLGRKVTTTDRKDMGVDSTGKGIIYLSESVSKASVKNPDKFKLEVISSRVSGTDQFGFNFPSFISLYDNNVKIFSERFNPRGFISPIANGAIGFYKFKFLGTFFENGRSVSSIRVTPRRKFEPLFSGIINIADDEWSIYSFDLMLTKTAQLEIIDSLHLTQLHLPIDKNIRRVKNQLISFTFNQFGIDAQGSFLTVYSDYDVKPGFTKKYFDNVIIKYDTGVNKKSLAYWDSTRAVPLEKEEADDYKKKDSTFKATKDSLLSSRSIDSLNKRQPKVKVTDIFLKGINRFHLTKTYNYRWGLEPILLPNTEYNTVEGLAINLRGFYEISKNRRRNSLRISPVIRYGFANTHFNAYATAFIRASNEDSTLVIKRHSFSFSGGKRVSDFNKEGNFPAINNTFTTLFSGKNYRKIYENYYGSFSYNKRYESGLRFSFTGLYEDRIPLENTTNYTFNKKDSAVITPNYPYQLIPTQFAAHSAMIIGVSVRFRPGQRYIQFPDSKLPIGSNYPTFTLKYVKGIKNIFGSDADFDKWRFYVRDDKNLKLAGTLIYKLGVGGFINNKKVFIQDHQYFNGDISVGAREFVNNFQLVPYYAFSSTAPFFTSAMAEHHFNGLITNKIPVLRNLKWNLVAGAKTFYVNKNNRYSELYAGLENIFKILGVNFIAGYDSNNKIKTGIMFTAGGILRVARNRVIPVTNTEPEL